MRMHKVVAAFALAALVAAACDNAMDSQQNEGNARVPAPGSGPALSVGSTATVQVFCPPRLQVFTGGQCFAMGLDSLGFYTSHSVSSWSSSSISTLIVTSTGQLMGQNPGTATVTATIGGISGTTTVPVRTDTDPTVSIDGFPVIQPNVSCVYTAVPSGGTGPFTYTWSVTSGTASGTASGNTWTGGSSVANASFVLKVVASDVDGRKSSATKSVFVHSGGSC
jgi:hypothetical protein